MLEAIPCLRASGSQHGQDREPLLGALLKVSDDFGCCKILVLLWFVLHHGAFSIIILWVGRNLKDHPAMWRDTFH